MTTQKYVIIPAVNPEKRDINEEKGSFGDERDSVFCLSESYHGCIIKKRIGKDELAVAQRVGMVQDTISDAGMTPHGHDVQTGRNLKTV